MNYLYKFALYPEFTTKIIFLNMKIRKSDKFQEVTLGPIKIKDGLYMGDEIAAKDIEFIISNKVTHVVNTVVHKIPNLWQNFSVHYLSVDWTQKQMNVLIQLTKIFDHKNDVLNTIFNFIQEAQKKGESCLVHSVSGKSRSFTIIVAYLLKKYKWSLSKCFEFIHNRKLHLQIRLNYLAQLEALEKRIKINGCLNSSWNLHNTEDEKVINNTYKNSFSLPIHVHQIKIYEKSYKKKKISWSNQNQTIVYSQNDTPPLLERKKEEIEIKPILKSSIQDRQRNLFYRSTAIKQKDKCQSDSLDRILYQSTEKKQIKNGQKDTPRGMGSTKRKNKKNVSEVRVKSLEIKGRSDQKQILANSEKKNKPVLTSYHALNQGTKTRINPLLSFEDSIECKENERWKSKDSEPEQNKTPSLNKQYQNMKNQAIVIKKKEAILTSSASLAHAQKVGVRSKKQRKSSKQSLRDRNKKVNQKS